MGLLFFGIWIKSPNRSKVLILTLWLRSVYRSVHQANSFSIKEQRNLWNVYVAKLIKCLADTICQVSSELIFEFLKKVEVSDFFSWKGRETHLRQKKIELTKVKGCPKFGLWMGAKLKTFKFLYLLFNESLLQMFCQKGYIIDVFYSVIFSKVFVYMSV